MELLDTTLREGEQCYGVFFSLETKIRLARMLDELGVDFIEVGHPAAAPSLREAAAAISGLDLRAPLLGHARLVEREIRMVRDLGLGWVGLFSGINEMSLRRYGMTRADVLSRIDRSINIAKKLGLSVRFTCEDASRTAPEDLATLYGRVRGQGADRVSYADTTGIDTPATLEVLSRKLGQAVPFETLHFHFHNDRGMALANARRAAQLGARCIDVSLLGVGERMGIPALEAMLALPADDPRRGVLQAAMDLAASSIDWTRFALRRFAHKSGIHVHGVHSDPRLYEQESPGAAGGRRIIVLSKLIGKTGLRLLLSRFGFTFDEAGIERVLSMIKAEDRLELAESAEIMRYVQACGLLQQEECVGSG